MATIFGLDSKVPANTKLTNGYNLYDWAMRMHSFPEFWGRDISGENKITDEELQFLKDRKTKIALIFDELDEVNISGNDGSQDAERAVEAAKELGVPQNKGIAIFANIHSDWSVNHNWMLSFANTLVNNGYVPGFIGNTDSSDNFNFDRQFSHYVQATAEEPSMKAVVCATEPKVNEVPEEWAPFAPSAMLPEDIGLWQFGTIGLNDVTANMTYAHDASVLDCMY